MRISITTLIVLVLMSCNRHSEKEMIAPAYASKVELKEPKAFFDGKITTLNGISFNKEGDVLYTSQQIDNQFDNGRFYAGIFESRYENGTWTEPKQIQLGLAIDAYHPVLSMDNEMLFFNSRSHLDSANRSVPHNIWAMRRTQNGWGIPEMVNGINSSTYDSYPSIAKSNNLYFNSDREGGKGSMDFYVSYYKDGIYQPPINLEALNSAQVENDLVVDPLERFIIFNRYIDSTREIDLYISLRKNNNWTSPRKLNHINSDEWELTPSLSPDGNYFFYELNSKIMQVELASIITSQELEEVGQK